MIFVKNNDFLNYDYRITVTVDEALDFSGFT